MDEHEDEEAEENDADDGDDGDDDADNDDTTTPTTSTTKSTRTAASSKPSFTNLSITAMFGFEFPCGLQTSGNITTYVESSVPHVTAPFR